MKKISILLASVAIVAFTFTSCKRDYSCDCDYSYNGGDAYSYSFDIFKATQDDAEEACALSEDQLNSAGYESNCELNGK
jgi:hypothetical protein